MSYEVRLDVFEGPFELLLALITERRLDVCDVPIARLTEDYLAHLELMHEMDLEVTTEFLVVAASLLQLKARSLLPRTGEEETDLQQDLERDVLIARLLEVRTFQSAGALLAGWLADGDRRFGPVPAPDDPSLKVMPTLAGIRPSDLGQSLVRLVSEMARTVDLSLLIADEVSTEEAGAELLARLARGAATFRRLVAGRDLGWAIATFLAMLELSARGEIVLGQGERLGEIEVMLAPGGSKQERAS